MIAQIFGWIGSAAFFICNIPQAYLIYKHGHANGLHLYTILLYLIACTLSLVYAVAQEAPALIFNFSTTLLLWLIIAKYKFFPRL